MKEAFMEAFRPSMGFMLMIVGYVAPCVLAFFVIILLIVIAEAVITS